MKEISMEYSEIPARSTLKPAPFRASASQIKLDNLQDLLRAAKIGPETYENSQENDRFGISHAWLAEALQTWRMEYNWRRTEERINTFPNFTVPINDDDGEIYNIHFVALFSTKANAVPIVLLHGWPGSFLEFLPLLDNLRTKYSPSTLPYHVVVPSQLGYCYSSGPSIRNEKGMHDMASVVNRLMVGLGFGDGYVAQGGDIGSYVSRILAVKHSSCKAVHLNFCETEKPSAAREDDITAAEMIVLERRKEHQMTGLAYAFEHVTRPATIGLVLSSSPVALLAWIGEKFLAWVDQPLQLNNILDFTTLWWLTETLPRSLFPYRDAARLGGVHGDPKYFIDKPFGFSSFPKEKLAIPKAWLKATGNLVWYRQHDEGGHFAAFEKPDLLMRDIEDFVAVACTLQHNNGPYGEADYFTEPGKTE